MGFCWFVCCLQVFPSVCGCCLCYAGVLLLFLVIRIQVHWAVFWLDCFLVWGLTVCVLLAGFPLLFSCCAAFFGVFRCSDLLFGWLLWGGWFLGSYGIWNFWVVPGGCSAYIRHLVIVSLCFNLVCLTPAGFNNIGCFKKKIPLILPTQVVALIMSKVQLSKQVMVFFR